jgi:hypothetical protein
MGNEAKAKVVIITSIENGQQILVLIVSRR